MSRPQSPVEIGEVLAEKYRVERVLGVGGMGVVVEATHLDLQKRVALKFMLKGTGDPSGESVARFMREGRAAAGLHSEHVARVLDVGRLDTGEPYMVMEFLQGRDLSDLIRGDGPQPVDRAVSYVLQACEAIAEAHARGIVHRDLKPSNLFLTQRADGLALVKVLDFGISKVARVQGDHAAEASMTNTRAILGSPSYMSPEQVRSSKNVDARTDIWALGIILYELLTAKPPFEADSLPGLIAAIISDAPVPVSSRRSDLPPGLAAAIMRCLDKAADKRFESVAAFARALEPFAEAEDVALVTRIVRLQKTAGLTKLDTARPPQPSMSDGENVDGPPIGSHATAATFGVTAKAVRRGPRVGFILAGIASLVLVSGGTAWFVAQSGKAASAAPDRSSDLVVLPVADALVEVGAELASDAGHDADLDSGADVEAEAPTITDALDASHRTPSKAKASAPRKSGNENAGGSKDAASKSGAAEPAPTKAKTKLDLSERR
jgi:eukaryotic-like serine/threonine-protein kinase